MFGIGGLGRTVGYRVEHRHGVVLLGLPAGEPVHELVHEWREQILGHLQTGKRLSVEHKCGETNSFKNENTMK